MISMKGPICNLSGLSKIAPKRRLLTARAGMQPGVDLVKSGAVRMVKPEELENLIAEGYKVLDTRPAYEHDRASVRDAVHVPYFIPDEATDPLTLIRKSLHAGFGGLWNGVPLTEVNNCFLEEVEKVFEGQKETKMVVTCSQGLRSLVTIKDLYDDGFTNLAWLYGGLCLASDLIETEGSMTLSDANIGGVSKIILDNLGTKSE